MPGKTLDKAALAALVSKKNVEEKSDEKNPLLGRLEALESNDEVTALMEEFNTIEGEPSDEFVGKLEALEKPADEESSGNTEAFDKLQEDFDKSQVELAASAEAVGKLETEITKLKSDLGAKEEESKPLVAVINDQIATMRIALSLSAVDMSEWSPEAIMKEHASISDTFQKLPSGSLTPDEQEENTEATQTRAEANAFDKLW